MNTLERRARKMEKRFGIAGSAPIYLITLTDRDLRSGEEDAYIRILNEAGLLHSSGSGVADFTVIPRGLNVMEAEMFVRENGAKILSGGLPCIVR